MPATGRDPLDSIVRSTFLATISNRTNAHESLPRRSVLRSRILRAAGKKVRVRTKEATIPTAARIPKSFSAGTGLKMLVRKPMAVVTVARTRAIPTVPMAVRAAPSTSCPRPISSR